MVVSIRAAEPVVNLQFGDLAVSLFAAALELLAAAGLLGRLMLAIGRRPLSRLVAAYLGDVEVRGGSHRLSAVALAGFLVLLQALPLIREGLLGPTHSPDHLSGAAVFAAEAVLAIWLWRGTTSQS